MARNATEKPVCLTRNKDMKDLVTKVRQVAQTGCPAVLITGENGTGKEVMARLFHYYGPRRDKPMVTINCGAIPADLAESTFFGHEKGAFTGAHEQRTGCFEQADGGTLFLDEIGEMPKSIQAKLLRVVELGTFRRLGGKEDIQVDISLISATNKILSEQVKSGDFREDLFYRLNVIELHVPPLRERKEDIRLLTRYYKDHFLNLYGKEPRKFSDDCIESLMKHSWPGNVRELKNAVERCVILSEGDIIDRENLPMQICKNGSIHPVNYHSLADKIIQIKFGSSLKQVEQEVINQTLDSVDNNKTEAAKILGFTRKTLRNHLDKHNNEA
ncbi:sigma-54 interaction domain-containing protein [Halalkalibaculum sp. DA384]|uniref:sigma-54 interaction domain-containing protein n=1 Tax=Halalkalibaculum sp. DA384 TaxID=3373606 RepID=UPI003753FAE3